MPRLTATSFALLGLLRRGPFSAYELTTHMQRSALAHLWPRTAAGIYREPAKLVAHGFATATEQRNGGRARTVYSITDDGRRALAAWLAEPGDPWEFECEAAVKVVLGDGGDLHSLRTTLARLSEHRPGSDPPPAQLVAGWLDGQMRFPEQLHFTAMAADLIARVADAVAGWATDWHELTATWESVALDDRSRAQAEEALRRVRAVVEPPGDPLVP